MKRICAVALVALLAVAGPVLAQQYSGYVCEVTLVAPTSGPYGSSGYLQLKLTSKSRCQGNDVPGVALYHLTQGATVAGADSAYLLTEGQLMAVLQAYSVAAANRSKVRINTKSFGGGLQVQGVTFLTH